uniref:Uncharacterized protein n=1 Tax=Trypanosoma cruzi TaxID=5693 RepID=Q86RL4_TRYCR|nr:unknown [Trypanosoma cruzi]
MVESIVSAALARSGIRVLHCDGEDDYGGAFKTMTVERMREYITGLVVAILLPPVQRTLRRDKTPFPQEGRGTCAPRGPANNGL